MGDPRPGRSALDAQTSVSEAQPLAAPRVFKPALAPSASTPPHGSEEMGAAPSRAPQTTMRAIEPIEIGDIIPHTPPTGEPILEHIDPRELLVDAAYQRGLSDKSLRLIRKIIAEWDWRKFKPPIVAMAEDGLQIIDGQHTTIAAASHPGIGKIPVMVVDAAALADRASAFIGHNRDRLNVTPMQIHHASIAAGDETATLVDRVCKRGGVNLVRSAHGGYKWKRGDSIAVGAVTALVAHVGEKDAAEILGTLVSADLVPVAATDIKAAELLFTDADYANELDELHKFGGVDLATAIRALGPSAAKEAKVFAAAKSVPYYRALAVVWFKKAKKRRKIG